VTDKHKFSEVRRLSQRRLDQSKNAILPTALAFNVGEFCRDLSYHKTRVPWPPCGIVCVILRLAVLVQLGLVSDGQTNGQTDGHAMTAITALA